MPDENDPPDLEFYSGNAFWYHDRAYMMVLAAIVDEQGGCHPRFRGGQMPSSKRRPPRHPAALGQPLRARTRRQDRPPALPLPRRQHLRRRLKGKSMKSMQEGEDERYANHRVGGPKAPPTTWGNQSQNADTLCGGPSNDSTTDAHTFRCCWERVGRGGRVLRFAGWPGHQSGHRGQAVRDVGAGRDAARQLRAADDKGLGGITIWLRGGDYLRTAALELSAADSGTAEAPVVWRAWQDETVRLLGGRTLSGVPAGHRSGRAEPVAGKGSRERATD